MSLTLTTAAAALKEDYKPVVQEQLNNAWVLLTQIEKNTKDVQGKRAVLSLHVRRNSGVGARLESGTLPTAGNQGYAEERIPLHYNYGRIEISGPTIRAMRSDRGSFVRAVESETKGVVTDLKNDVSRQVYGTSDGKIAQCGTTTASATVVLTSPTETQLDQLLSPGMKVDIGTVASPSTVVASATVVNVDYTNGTVTIDSAVTTSATHFIFRAGSGGSGANQAEITGLQTIVSDTGAVFNVDPATEPVWKSYVDANGGTGRAATETLFTKVANKANRRGGAEIDLWITSDGVHRNLASSLQTLKRFNGTVEIKGGYSGLEITPGGGKSAVVVWDKDAPSKKAFGLSTSELVQFEASDWEFMDEDGAMLSRVSGKDAYEATLFKYHELATHKRNAHARIDDLNES